MAPEPVPKKRVRSRGTHQERKERQKLRQQSSELEESTLAACSSLQEYHSRFADIEMMLNSRSDDYQDAARKSKLYTVIISLLSKTWSGENVNRELRDAEMEFWRAHGLLTSLLMVSTTNAEDSQVKTCPFQRSQMILATA